MRVGRNTRIVMAFAALVTCGAAAWLFVPPVPPAPADLSQFDPMVASAIRRPLWEARILRFDPDRWLRLGMVYEANDVPNFALECYQYVVKRRPGDARNWYRLACAAEKNGDAASAIEYVDRAIALSPKFAPLHWRRGWWLLELGQVADARKSFEFALQIDDDETAARAGLASCMLQQNETPQAIEILERLARKSRNAQVRRILANAYLQAGRREEALVQMHIAGEATGVWPDEWTNDMAAHTTSITSIMLSAVDLAETDPASAERFLLPLEAIYPESVALQCRLGKINGQLGKNDEAQSCFERALQIDPKYGMASAGMSAVYHARREFAKALEWIDRAIECNSRAGYMHIQRGKVLMDMVRDREAIMEFERAYELEPGNSAALVLKGRAQLKSSDFRGAEESFRRALAGNPTMASAHVGLALVQIDTNRLDEAEESLQAAASFDDADAELPIARRILDRKRESLKGSPAS